MNLILIKSRVACSDQGADHFRRRITIAIRQMVQAFVLGERAGDRLRTVVSIQILSQAFEMEVIELVRHFPQGDSNLTTECSAAGKCKSKT